MRNSARTVDCPRTEVPRAVLAMVIGLTTLSLCGLGLATPLAAQEAVRRFERVRTYDVQHIKANLNLDFEQRVISGTVTHTLQPLHDGFREFALDAEQLTIKSVTVDGRPQQFELKEPKLRIALDRVYRRTEVMQVAVEYRGSPARGIFFVKPDEFYPQKPVTAWTQGEPESNHFWLPCYDYPNDLTTTEMIVTVPEQFFALSNGRLVDTEHKPQDKTKTYHWHMEQPHATYLISLAAGDLVPFEEEVDGLKLTSYASRAQYDEATMRRSFGRTPEMLRLFNKLIGVSYPWVKYSQVTVPEFRSGGMENITATTLVDFSLRDEHAMEENTVDHLVAHELAHQWWGNLLTCKDWSHLWLNEGFATYFDALFTEHQRGPDEFAFQMEDDRRSGIAIDAHEPRAMVWDGYGHPGDMFDARAYPRGASVLHMLRGLLGDDAFYRALGLYAKNNRHRPVETRDLQLAMEGASGRKLDWFFQQWCYKAGSPKLAVSWKWNPEDSTVRLQVRQTQTITDQVPLFRLPTIVECQRGSERTRFTLDIDRPEAEWAFRLPAEPQLVQVDPDHFLMAEWDVTQPVEAWRFQLEHAPQALSRGIAAHKLGEMPPQDAHDALLCQAFSRETCGPLRADILRALGKIKGPGAKSLLLTAVNDKLPLIRRIAIDQLGHFDGPEVSDAIRNRWHAERAPQARAAVLRQYSKKKLPGWEALLEQAINEPSYRSTVGKAALDMMFEQEHPRRRELLYLNTRRGVNEQTRAGAIAAVGKLAKIDSAQFTVLRSLLDEPSWVIQRATLTALEHAGGLDDAKLLVERSKSIRDPDLASYYIEAATGIRKRLPADPLAAADAKAKDMESQAQQLELQAQSLRGQAQQTRAKAGLSSK